MNTPSAITCVECGGVAHRVSLAPDESLEVGDIVVYACEDCDHRHDIVVDSPTGVGSAE